MGIPKFFRFMSERYPLISQVVQENRIPEFDALYLDMNGIIHNCSHPNDNDASHRITDEQIFLAIFQYVSHLFAVIRPKKLFFLAVDGVAPRAKMNQQRSRRFRTAKEAKDALDKARRRGDDIPEGDAFDSNCITPGTPFMAKLSEQLKYFLAKKVSEDSDWRGVEIVLSGHDVPGEGEHKVMEYIRLNRAQPGYDPNRRHCLYGLDADLIMLGLLSHDPHFALLREEVTFGPRSKSKTKTLETQTFFLLHLSLFREYLDLEFSSLKNLEPPLPFEYDLERIIDDFILINIFIGNDFLPHLPSIHIHEGALGRLFEIYKRILPKAGGYLNEHGTLSTKRLQLLLDELSAFEREQFESEFADSNWFKGKQTKPIAAMEKARARNKLVLNPEQKRLFEVVRKFVIDNLEHLNPDAELEIDGGTLTARDRRFLTELADELNLEIAHDAYNDDGENIVVVSFSEEMVEMARAEREDDDDVEVEGGGGDDAAEDYVPNGKFAALSVAGKNGAGAAAASASEWQHAIERVFRKYDKAEVAQDFSDADWEGEYSKQLELKMNDWKRNYYKEKLEIDFDDKDEVTKLAFRYIEGLQWVLNYYYKGVSSWAWFYDYHYAPRITDLSNVANFTFNFELGEPFRPFEQLMGVLPALSAAHIPPAFRDLMTDATSPIIDFYPTNFAADLNGKKQDWEAVVKIPFIDEKRLLSTMATREPRLTREERQRNSFGQSWRFTYDPKLETTLASSLPGFFPDIHNCHARMEPFHLPTLEGGLSFVKGLLPGVLLGRDAVSGFPSLNTIPHFAQLGLHGVNVFQSDSRNETMVVSIENTFEGSPSEEVARALVNKRVYVGYPYLRESLVTAVSDELFRYEMDTHGVRPIPHRPDQVREWRKVADRIEYVYSKKQGCLLGKVDVLVHATPVKGLKLLEDGSRVKEYEEREDDFALQAIVENVSSEDVRFAEQDAIPIEEEFPVGSKVFFLGMAAYGVPAQVLGHSKDRLAIRIAYFPRDKVEDRVFKQKIYEADHVQYYPSFQVTKQLRMSALTLAKLTSSLMVSLGEQKVNIGLNLKFEAKSQKVLGYTQRNESGWEYSDKAIQLIREYKEHFPEVIAVLKQKRGADLTRATDFFGDQAKDRLAALKAWLTAQGVRDFEKIPLYSDQLEKRIVMALEQFADKLMANKKPEALKQAAITGIPRQGLLHPAHSANRLRDQRFVIGDRVVMVAENTGVPLSAKGTVVGIQSGLVDVVFDVQFIGGTSLSDRCSQYRGASVSPTSLLNLTDVQYAQMVQGQAPMNTGPKQPAENPNALFRRGPRGGPAIVANRGKSASGFTPASPSSRGRGRGGFASDFTQGRDTMSHQQRLAATLGATPQKGPAWQGAPPSSHTNGTPPTILKRGSPAPISGAVSVGRGIAVPPPANLEASPRGRNGMRGGRGGSAGRARGRGRGLAPSNGSPA